VTRAPLEPRPSRPRFASSYGISTDAEGLVPWTWAEERLVAARNYWISSVRPDGGPHTAPVWELWIDGAVVFGTSPASRKGRNLLGDPRAVVHLESGDEVVVLEGDVERIELDESLADAYDAKYGVRPGPGELWLRLVPRRAYAWLEADYPRTATRFDF
jgi:hypothetical protein